MQIISQMWSISFSSPALAVTDSSFDIVEPSYELHFYRSRSKGDNVQGSIRPSVHPPISALTAEPILGAKSKEESLSTQGVCLCVK